MRLTPLALALAAALAVAACEEQVEQVGDDGAVVEDPADTTAPATPAQPGTTPAQPGTTPAQPGTTPQ